MLSRPFCRRFFETKLRGTTLTWNASVGDLTTTLQPLLGFAITLPLLGIMMFRCMAHAVRKIGSLVIA